MQVSSADGGAIFVLTRRGDIARSGPGGTLADTTLIMDRSIRDGDWGRLGALLSGSEPRFIEIE